MVVAAPRAHARRSMGTIVLWLGLAFVAVYTALLFYLMRDSSYDAWGAMFVGPVLFAATLPALARQARREEDSRVLWILVAALAVKMLVSLFRYYHGFYVVDKSDARSYDTYGTQIAERFLDGRGSGLSNLLETNWIRFFTGVIYTVIRPSVVSGFLIYAWLAFLGTYFFYRAFVLAVPDGNRKSYRRWLFFLPSMLFWPSSIGKESWLMFGLGIAAFGAAKMLRGRFLPGIVISIVGLGLAALVRAPIAVVLGLGIVVGGVLRKVPRSHRQLAPVAKLASVGILAVGAVFLFTLLQGYLGRSDLRGANVDTLVSESLRLTGTGGSEFTPTAPTSPIGLGIVTITVLFRPFLFEAHTVEAVAASIEGSILLVLTIVRFRSVVASFINLRRIPYLAVAMIYVGGSIIALSPVANFGIIDRQRTLIYPMYLVLLCIPWKKKEMQAEASAVLTPEETRTPAASGSRA